MEIVLASGSPRRRDLLENLGWRVRVIVPEIDERPLPSEPPEDLCLRLAAAKAAKVAGMFDKDSLVTAADTIVVVDGDVLGKPADEGESLLMLKRLQGRAHDVLTGICVIGKGKTLCGLERTRVIFRALDDEAVRAYAASGEGADKAGAYAIQGKGSLLVSSIEGDYFNVVGLPLCRLGMMIEELGLKLPRQWGENI
jgi:septum formation protein